MRKKAWNTGWNFGRMLVLSYCLLLPHSLVNASVQMKAPDNLHVEDDTVTDTSLFLTWDQVAKADSYKVDVQPPSIGVIGIGSGLTDKFTRIQGLDPDTEYTIRVMAVKDGVEGIPAVAWKKTALSAPDNLHVIQETLQSDSMQVEWGEVKGAESYLVEVSPSSGVSGHGDAIYKTSTTLRGLVPNTVYTITIRTRNWVGLGGSYTIRQPTLLPSPTNVRTISNTISHDTMSINWDAVSGAKGYKVTLDPPDNVKGIGSDTKDTLVTIRQMEADKQYTVKIAAVNEAGASSPTNLVVKTLTICYAKAMDYLAEEKVTIDCPARCGKYQEHIYGTKEYTDDSYICTAAVHDGRVDDSMGGTVTIKKRNGLPHYIGTVSNGVSSMDYGAWSKSFVFGLDAPKELRVIEGSIEHSGVQVEWGPVLGSERYTISVAEEGASLSERGLQSSLKENRATLSNLNPDTPYVVTVLATNHLEVSEESTVAFRTALKSPQNLRIDRQSVTLKSFSVFWDKVDGAHSYQLTVQETNEASGYIYDTTVNEMQLTGLHSGTEYQVSVRAVNRVGRGGVSTIKQYTKIGAPEDIMVDSRTSSTLRLKWSSVEGAKYYRVESEPCCARIASDPQILATTVWLENLMPNTKYNITVFAVNIEEESVGSTIYDQTSLPPPVFLRVREGTLTHDHLTLEWEKIAGASSYAVSVELKDVKGEISYTVPGNITYLYIDDLKPDTPYVFRLQGMNDVGKGAERKEVANTLLPPPLGLTVDADPEYPHMAVLKWEKRDRIGKYRIWVEPNDKVQGTGDHEAQNDPAVTKNQAVLAGLNPGESYRVNIAPVLETMLTTGQAMQHVGMNATATFTTALPPPEKVWIDPKSITPYSMDVHWHEVKKASSYKVTFNNLDTEHVKTVTGIQSLSVTLEDMEPASKYQILVVSVQQMEDENDEKGKVFTSYTGEPIYGMTQIDSPAMVMVTKTSINGSIAMMWEKVEKADRYRVGLQPNSGIVGTGVYNINETSAELSGLKTDIEYKVFVIAENNEFGLTSKRSFAIQTVRLGPTKVTGQGLQVHIKTGEKTTFEEENMILYEGSGIEEIEVEMETEVAQKGGLQGIHYTIIIIGSVLLFLLLCVIVPCVLECRKCKKEGHCCCFCCQSSHDDEEEYVDELDHSASKKAQMAGY